MKLTVMRVWLFVVLHFYITDFCASIVVRKLDSSCGLVHTEGCLIADEELCIDDSKAVLVDLTDIVPAHVPLPNADDLLIAEYMTFISGSTPDILSVEYIDYLLKRIGQPTELNECSSYVAIGFIRYTIRDAVLPHNKKLPSEFRKLMGSVDYFMVRPGFHGNGYGTFLFSYAKHIFLDYGVAGAVLRAMPLLGDEVRLLPKLVRFYNRQGCMLVHPSLYTPGESAFADMLFFLP